MPSHSVPSAASFYLKATRSDMHQKSSSLVVFVFHASVLAVGVKDVAKRQSDPSKLIGNIGTTDPSSVPNGLAGLGTGGLPDFSSILGGGGSGGAGGLPDFSSILGGSGSGGAGGLPDFSSILGGGGSGSAGGLPDFSSILGGGGSGGAGGLPDFSSFLGGLGGSGSGSGAGSGATGGPSDFSSFSKGSDKASAVGTSSPPDSNSDKESSSVEKRRTESSENFNEFNDVGLPDGLDPSSLLTPFTNLGRNDSTILSKKLSQLFTFFFFFGSYVCNDPLASLGKRSLAAFCSPADDGEHPVKQPNATSSSGFYNITRPLNTTHSTSVEAPIFNEPTTEDATDELFPHYFGYRASKLKRAACTDVHFVFARGTTELQGFGIVGAPLDSSFKSAYSSYSSYAVVYPAAIDQNSFAGSRAAEAKMERIVSSCPDTQIILGGYSQGASLVHGIRATPAVKNAVKAILLFGDPFLNFVKPSSSNLPINDASGIFDACNKLDIVCGIANANSIGTGTSHLGYVGGVTTAAAAFARGKVSTA